MLLFVVRCVRCVACCRLLLLFADVAACGLLFVGVCCLMCVAVVSRCCLSAVGCNAVVVVACLLWLQCGVCAVG